MNLTTLIDVVFAQLASECVRGCVRNLWSRGVGDVLAVVFR